MARWVALLRGINVGGRNRVRMQSLVKIFGAAGCTNVSTHLQSGNVVFDACIESTESFVGAIGDHIERNLGFRPDVMLLTSRALRRAIDRNPYPHATTAPATLHLFVLAGRPTPTRLRNLSHLATASESFRIDGRCLYLHAPQGIGRSKLVRQVDRVLGMPTTARNWRTVLALAELAETDGSDASGSG